MSFSRVLLLLFPLVVAIQAINLRFRASERDNLKYWVFKKGAHEWTVCKGVTQAVKAEQATLKSCPLMADLITAFSANNHCNIAAKLGGLMRSALARKSNGAAKSNEPKPWVKGDEGLDDDDISDKVKDDDSDDESNLEVDDSLPLGQDDISVPPPGQKKAPSAKYKKLYAALIKGAREMDMPCKKRDNYKSYNCLRGVLAGGILGKATELFMKAGKASNEKIAKHATGIELKTFSPAARASHFGALSIGHCQTASRPDDKKVPGVVEALKNPKIFNALYKFGYNKRPIPNPTQKDVREAIIALITHFYSLSIEYATKGKYAHFMAHMARLGHTIGDSFSCSHTVREAKAPYKLLFFQDYGGQDGDKHAKAGDDLTGKYPFTPPSTRTPLAGFAKTIDYIQTAFQIAIRDVCSQQAAPQYTPVPYKSVNPDLKAGSPEEELQSFFREVILEMADAYFEDYDASGCVTMDTRFDTALGKEKTCRLRPITQAKYLLEQVCPDHPILASRVME